MYVRPLVSVVDNDESIRESLESLIRSVGFAAKVFASGEEFRHSEYPLKTDCLILDVRLPGMNGPSFSDDWRPITTKFQLFLLPHMELKPGARERLKTGRWIT